MPYEGSSDTLYSGESHSGGYSGYYDGTWTITATPEDYIKSSKFKVGDLVKIHKPIDTSKSPTWITPDMDKYDGKIIVLTKTSGYYWRHDRWNFSENWLELINNKVDNKQTIMQKLNSMIKRLLDKDSQALYEAGFIDGDLRITQRGKEELDGIIFEANKAELVRLAKE